MNKNLRIYVAAALMAALSCVATMAIKFPSPTGYIHPGDAFVLLSGVILGPIYGPLAAGIGSMTADLLAGYPQFAFATLFIKALAALVAALIYRKGKISTIILSGVIGELLVTSGYFIFENFLYGFGPAVKSIPLNLVQNALGITLATLLFPILRGVPQIRELMDHRYKGLVHRSRNR